MSHISKIELVVNDIRSLKAACIRLGLSFAKNQTSFKWWGRKNGICNHAIKIPGTAYEIGVHKQADRYDLLVDYYDPAVEAAIGSNAGKLKQAYAIERTRTEARRKGYTVVEKQTEDGIRLSIRAM
jgi:hypothetical protein